MVSRIKDTESGAGVSQRGGGKGSRASGDVSSSPINRRIAVSPHEVLPKPQQSGFEIKHPDKVARSLLGGSIEEDSPNS